MGEMSVTELWTLLLAGASAIILLLNLADKLAGIWERIKAPDKKQAEQIEKLERRTEALGEDVEGLKNALGELQRHHEDDMGESREERQLIVYALLGCLNGLQQLGCNSKVTEAAAKVEKYVNQKAHEK